MDISNKSLALILVVAIVVSIGGTYVSLGKLNSVSSVWLTGRAVDTDVGRTNLTIQSTIAIRFTPGSTRVDFGAGYANDTGGGIQTCTIDTNGTDPTSPCVNFNSGLSPLIIENSGNLDIGVNLTSNASKTEFIPTGSSTVNAFQWFAEDNESGSCSSYQNSLNTTWQDISTTETALCAASSFESDDPTDSIKLHLKVVIPEDAVPGTREATITAEGYT